MPSVSLVLLLAMLQVPQAATDLACAMDQIPAADRAAFIENGLREAESLGPAGDRLSDAAVSCGARLGWDAHRTGTLAGLPYATILQAGSGQKLAQAGIAIAEIEQWFAQQNLAVRTESASLNQAINQLVEELIARRRVPDAESEPAGLIGMYLGARVTMERVERGLPID